MQFAVEQSCVEALFRKNIWEAKPLKYEASAECFVSVRIMLKSHNCRASFNGWELCHVPESTQLLLGSRVFQKQAKKKKRQGGGRMREITAAIPALTEGKT